MSFAYANPSKITGRSCAHGTCASRQRSGVLLQCPTLRRPGGHLHCGFTLLEVLIAIVVLSIGLLGLAGLQAAGLRNNNSAYMRTIATQQANDMADRMRTNLPGVITNAYDSIGGIPANPGCITTNCTIAQVAQYDAFDWNTMNQSLLPLGVGTVKRIASPPGVDRFTISVSWDDNRTGAVDTTFTITTEL